MFRTISFAIKSLFGIDDDYTFIEESVILQIIERLKYVLN